MGCGSAACSSRTFTARIRRSRTACVSPSARRRKTTGSLRHCANAPRNTFGEHDLNMQRQAHVTRNTLETQITVSLNLDGTGARALNTQVPFLDHMLEQVARHGVLDLEVDARGD